MTMLHESQYFLIALRTFIPLAPIGTAAAPTVDPDPGREMDEGKEVGAEEHREHVQALGWEGAIVERRRRWARTGEEVGRGVEEGNEVGAELQRAQVQAEGCEGDTIVERGRVATREETATAREED